MASATAGRTEMGLADRLRERTHELHTRAERTGILAEILQGRADRSGYALLLRSLLPVYRSLEAGLDAHRDRAAIGPLALPVVYRASAIASDLQVITGTEHLATMPPLPSAARYAERIAEAARGDGARLVAHAYVRFLGDLNGGRILQRLVGRALALGDEATRFYAYPAVADLAALRAGYRGSIDAAGAHVDAEAVLDEAVVAFERNIELAEAVRQAAARGLA
jgi:heme oxygenase